MWAEQCEYLCFIRVVKRGSTLASSMPGSIFGITGKLVQVANLSGTKGPSLLWGALDTS